MLENLFNRPYFLQWHCFLYTKQWTSNKAFAHWAEMEALHSREPVKLFLERFEEELTFKTRNKTAMGALKAMQISQVVLARCRSVRGVAHTRAFKNRTTPRFTCVVHKHLIRNRYETDYGASTLVQSECQWIGGLNRSKAFHWTFEALILKSCKVGFGLGQIRKT